MSAIPFQSPIDLGKNELQNARIQNLAADPATPVEGQVYHKTADHFTRIHNGTAFKQVPFVDNDTPQAETVADTAAVGTSGNAARADHVHAMPGLATSSSDGFMPQADKAKLDGATATGTASKLVLRDAAGRAQMVDPSAAQDIATKNYIDTRHIGDLTAPNADFSMNTHKITSVTDPASAQDAATKNYVDTRHVTDLTAPAADFSMNSHKITNLTDPASAQDAATKAYVDSVAQGLAPKPPVRCATVAAGTLASSFANGQVVDGITLATGDRVLIKTQAAPAENGIYTVNASGAPTRALDLNAWSEAINAFVFVELGTVNADCGFVCTADPGGTLGTTAIPFVQFSGAGTFTAANDSGVTGTGVYDNTTGSQFRFRGIKAGSTKVGISLSTKDILVDINEANLTLVNLGGTLSVAKGGTGATDAATARSNLGATTKVSADITGDGSTLSFTVTHNLNTRDVTVQVWEKSGSYREVMVEKDLSSVNAVAIVFATAPAISTVYRVVVVG